MRKSTPAKARAEARLSSDLEQVDAGQQVERDIAKLPTFDEAMLERVRELQGKATSDNTKAAYQEDWRRFSLWCEERGHEALPAHPYTVAVYLTRFTATGTVDMDLLAEMGVPVPDAEETESRRVEYKPDGTLYASNTLARWLAAINKIHEISKLPRPGDDPSVALVMDGIRRTNGGELRRMPALLVEDMRALVTAIDINSYPRGVIGTRDYALIVMGFAGAFRRSELAALTIGDVTFHKTDGLFVRVAKSKTDQEARGRTKALPYGTSAITCPVCAYMRWLLVTEALSNPMPRVNVMKVLGAANLEEHICARGQEKDAVDWADPFPPWRRLPKRMPLFRPVSTAGRIFRDEPISPQVVHHAVLRHAKNAGMDERHFGAHSLRAGFITSALRVGSNPHQIMRQSWHTSEKMIEVYGREHAPLDNNAVTDVGL